MKEATVAGRAGLISGVPERLFAGTSGWAYPTWKPGFYPEGLARRRFLEFYASQLNGVEVNYTFRALPTAATVAEWLAATPRSFRFSFKAPQRVTHFNRLRDAGPEMERFLTAIEPVRAAGKMGHVLVQLPPTMKADAGLLREFLTLPVLRGEPGLRLSFEFRHASWLVEEIFEVLHAADAALCVAHAGDEPGDLEVPEIHTSRTHTSFRLRRSGGYTAEELRGYAQKMREVARRREVYVALRHEDEPTGALNARWLLEFAAMEGGVSGAATRGKGSGAVVKGKRSGAAATGTG